jgi:hypothetical protein
MSIEMMAEVWISFFKTLVKLASVFSLAKFENKWTKT